MNRRPIWTALILLLGISNLYSEDESRDYNDPYYAQEWNSCGSVIRLDAEFLWLRTCPDGLYVASKLSNRSTATAEGSGAVIRYNRTVDAATFDPEFKPGVRVGVAYQPAQSCCWDVALKWTYFSPEYKRIVKRNPDDTFKEQFVPFSSDSVFENMSDILGMTNPLSTINDISSVQGDWDLNFSSIDLELGRRFWVGNCFSVRPHVDLRFATIEQNLRITTVGTLAGELLTANFAIIEHFKNEFTGIGPRIGLELEWDIGCGAGFYGSSALALLYGDRDAYSAQGGERTNTIVDGNPANGQNTVGLTGDTFSLTTYDTNKKHCSRPSLDLDFGFFWSTCVGAGRYNIMLKLGWEHHYYFNQGVGDAAAGYILRCKEESGALSTHGLRLAGSVYF